MLVMSAILACIDVLYLLSLNPIQVIINIMKGRITRERRVSRQLILTAIPKNTRIFSGSRIKLRKVADILACTAVTSFVNREIRFPTPVSYTHLRAHETGRNLVCRLLLEK